MTPTLHLENAFCIPSFRFNLLSVSKITKALNCSVIFLFGHCVFVDLQVNKHIGLGRKRDGLYYLEPTLEIFASSVTHSDAVDLWHWFLGHPAPILSSKFTSLNPGISFSNRCPCKVCP